MNVALEFVTFVNLTSPPLDKPTCQVLLANGETPKAVGFPVKAELVKVPLEFEATLILFILNVEPEDALVNKRLASLSKPIWFTKSPED